MCSYGRGTEDRGQFAGIASGKLQSILNKSLEFWNLIDTYNPDVIIGTESWLREEISNVEVFRDEYTTCRRDTNTRGGGVFVLKITLLE